MPATGAKDLVTQNAMRPANPTWGLDFSLSVWLVLLCTLLTGVAVLAIGALFFATTDIVPLPYRLMALGGAVAACSRVDVLLPGARAYSRVVLSGAAFAGTGVVIAATQALGAADAESVPPATALGFVIEAMVTVVPFVAGVVICFGTLRFARRSFASALKN